MPNDYFHKSVLCKEILNYIVLKEGDVFVDCTVGFGGHSLCILQNFTGIRLVGIDCDSDAIGYAHESLKDYKDKITLVQGNFRYLGEILKNMGIAKINGCLFDLGVSSLHLDNADRGFSFRKNGPLDMRMDCKNQTLTAGYIVNRFEEQKLFDIINNFGEERFTKRIVRRILEERKKHAINTTGELSDIVAGAVGGFRSKIHPATRTFQALRIAVNDELNTLKEGLMAAVSYMVSGGIICAVTFHSLEDRIVKNVFRDYKKVGSLNLITKKPVRPQPNEVSENSRSRSAKLRVAQKV